MTWTCETKTLRDAARQAARCGGNEGTVRLAGNNDGIEIRSANAVSGMRYRHVVDAKCDTHNVTVVPAKVFAGIIDTLGEGTVTISFDEEGAQLNLVSGRARFGLRCLDAATFTEFTLPSTTGITVDGVELAAAAARVLPAVSVDPARAALTGVLFESTDTGLRLVATDSYRLAWSDLPGSTLGQVGSQAVVPGALLSEVARSIKSGDVDVVIENDAIHFGTGGTWISSTLIAAPYPAYKTLLNVTPSTTAELPAADLIHSLEAAGALLRHASSEPVRVRFDDSGVTISARSNDVGSGSTQVPGDVTGDSIEAGFNVGYLTSAIKTISGDIRMELQDPARPVLVTPVDGGHYGTLVMPVRLPG